MHLDDFDFSQLVRFQDLGFAWMDFESLRIRTFLESAIIF